MPFRWTRPSSRCGRITESTSSRPASKVGAKPASCASLKANLSTKRCTSPTKSMPKMTSSRRAAHAPGARYWCLTCSRAPIWPSACGRSGQSLMRQSHLVAKSRLCVKAVNRLSRTALTGLVQRRRKGRAARCVGIGLGLKVKPLLLAIAPAALARAPPGRGSSGSKPV